MKKLQIAVIGASGDKGVIDKSVLDIAYNTGREIAARGYVLITGGLGGVMEAACKGAQESGGITVGILPGDKKEKANKYCSVIIPTGIGYARDFINVYSADGIVVINGVVGTDIEARLAAGDTVPIVAMAGTGGVAEELAGKKPYKKGGRIFSAETPGRALEILEELIKVYK